MQTATGPFVAKVVANHASLPAIADALLTKYPPSV